MNVVRNNQFAGYFDPSSDSRFCLAELIFDYLCDQGGINIYQWGTHCQNCDGYIFLYSYYLFYELEELSSSFELFQGLGVGDIAWIDNKLMCQFPTIRKSQEKSSTGEVSQVVTNYCAWCGMSQSKNSVVVQPEEILIDLYVKRDMEKHLYKIIPVTKSDKELLEDLKNYFQ